MAIRRTTLAIGTISSGTLRLEDLSPALISALEDVRLSRKERTELNEIRRHLDRDPTPDTVDLDAATDELEEAQGDYDALVAIAENHVPDYCYFGSLEGDGADLGVWPDQDVLNGRGDGFVLMSRDTPAVDGEFTHWLSVNDHGNATLYRRAGRRWLECWSVV